MCMTELERILTDTLSVLERELRQEQETQGTILVNQQHTMATHANTLRQLQQQVGHLSAQQQESTQHLQRLSAIYENLEPLLARLNAILNGRQRG